MMRVLSIIGFSKSGKTTTIEEVIKILRKRGYSVGSVKEIHFEDFHLDEEGTNTYRHKEAGSQLVTARGIYETDILVQEKLSINKILDFYDYDFVILEGVRDTAAPKIIAAHDEEGIESDLDDTVFAISGKISGQFEVYKGLPVINALTEADVLVDLIIKKVFPRLPDVKEECCRACGFSCKELCGRILSEKSQRSDCVLEDKGIVLKMKGKEMVLVPFVQKILQNAIEGIVKELDGYFEDGDIEICIKK